MHEADLCSDVLTVRSLQHWGQSRLAGIDARRESEMLLGHALDRDRAWLFAHATDAIDAPRAAAFRALIERRAEGTPVAYLMQRREFWTLDLRVTPATLIPRAETELLVEAALERVPYETSVRIVDLGTGSGAIALSVARERPRALVLATDVSAAALDVARDNARLNHVDNISFELGDWYAPLAGERFDLLLSNPPYIAVSDAHLVQGDLRFEPRSALVSGSDGLDAIRVLAAGAADHLVSGGWVLIEHGFDQGAAVRELLQRAGLEAVQTLRDLEQRERVSLGQRRSG